MPSGARGLKKSGTDPGGNGMKRLHYYDNLRVILMFLVLFGHFCEISAGSTTYGAFLRFFIYIFHMPLFVFVTGLFHSNDSREKIIHRSIGFLMIYLLMKILGLFNSMLMYGRGGLSLVNEGGIPWFMLALCAWNLMAYVTRSFNTKLLFTVSILVALAAGYDYSLTTQFSISRVLVFWPFYLAGMMADREVILSYMRRRTVKWAGAATLAACVGMLWLNYDRLSFIRPLLTGKHAYDSLAEPFVTYGGLVRLGVYVLAVVLSLMVMAVIPDRELFFTRYGSRTLPIYFFCLPVYQLSNAYFPSLRIWQYFVLSIVLIPVLGNKWFNKALTSIIR